MSGDATPSPARRSGSRSALPSMSRRGCNGFVVNLGHEAPGLEERVQRFAEEVWPTVVRSSLTQR